MIGSNHKQAIKTVVESKSGFAVIAMVEKKTADPVGAAIVDRLNPFVGKCQSIDV